MDKNMAKFLWNLFTELRKELVSLQNIRSQIIGFKITFVGTSIALIGANFDKVPKLLFLIPGFAAIFFDLLIQSYSNSIKKSGFYCRNYIETLLKDAYSFPQDWLLWEDFMVHPNYKQKNILIIGNVGLTLIASAFAVVSLFDLSMLFISGTLLFILFVLVTSVGILQYKPSKWDIKQKCHTSYIPPKASVAIIIIDFEEHKILLSQRAFEPKKGEWDIPGGFIEIEETAEMAAIREFWEETQTNIKIKKYLGSLPDKYGNLDIPTLNLCYFAEIIGGELKPQSDVKKLAWFLLDDLPPLAFPHQNKIINWCCDHIPYLQSRDHIFLK